MKDIFNGLVKTIPELSNSPSPVPEKQNRVVLILSSTINTKLLNNSLYDSINDDLICQKWMIETLHPIPVLSQKKEEIERITIENLLGSLAVKQQPQRAICTCGEVIFGIIGRGRRMGFGSVGDIVERAIKATFLLPSETSWIDRQMSDILQVATYNNEAISIDGTEYFPFIKDKR